jgi:hypothetical protein
MQFLDVLYLLVMGLLLGLEAEGVLELSSQAVEA